MGTMKARVEVRLLRTVLALHAVYDTVHRALINRHTHTYAVLRLRVLH